MPIYEYQASEEASSCPHCRDRFEEFQKVSDPRLETCPRCGCAVRRLISVCSTGESKSGLDRRAKDSGFHKLVKRDKGTYEKTY